MIINKPIVFFDLETTGVNTAKDRIVQIALLKIYPDGKQEAKKTLINPGIPIPPVVTAIHGITDQMVVGAPTFAQIAKSLAEQLHGCDIGGYNSNSFDFPLLMEEFYRAGVVYPQDGEEIFFADAFLVEKKVNSHKLADTYKRYTGKVLEGAHDAQADVAATVEVLFAQLEKLGDLTIQEIDELCQGDKKRHDYAGRLYEHEGKIYWNFGKHQNELVTSEPQYADWVLRSDFPADTKNKIKQLLENEKTKTS